MPRPRNERQALEEELADLPDQVAAYRRDLAATPAEGKTRREMLEWQIRRAHTHISTPQRLADLARLLE